VSLLEPVHECPECGAKLVFTLPYDHAREQETADLRSQLAQQSADLANAERALIAADDIRNRHRGEPENWDDYDAARYSASTVKP